MSKRLIILCISVVLGAILNLVAIVRHSQLPGFKEQDKGFSETHQGFQTENAENAQ